MSKAAETEAAPSADLAALARGGRINFFGFILRLIARLPFLFIAGRIYGADELGRFAYAVLIVEFAAQLATLGVDEVILSTGGGDLEDTTTQLSDLAKAVIR